MISHSGVTANSQNMLLGAAMMLTAVLTMTVQDAVFKRFSSELTLWQIFALRGVLATSLLVILFSLRRGGGVVLKSALMKWPLIRSALLTIALLAFYTAIPFVSLATAGAALYVAPILVLLLSAFVVKEQVRPLGWVGALLGLVGVIVLLQPGTDDFSPWTLLPVVGAAFYAVAHIVTRLKCRQVPMMSLALSLNLLMLLAGLLVSMLLYLQSPQGQIAQSYPYVFGTWSAIETTDWLLLGLLAALAVVIGMMLAGAYQIAPPPVMATFEYSYLVFAAVWDLLLFKIVPTSASVTGMLLIVMAGLMVIHRKTR